jgi:hypothetical protein
MSKIEFFGKTTRTEAQLEKAFKQALIKRGFLCYKFSSPAKRAVPDAILIGPNGFVAFVEFKNPIDKTQLTKLQEIEVGKLKLNNANVFVVGTGDEAEKVFLFLLSKGGFV